MVTVLGSLMEETVSTVQISNLMLAIVVVTMAIALFAAIVFLVKRMPSSGFLHGRFGPNARLSVLETVQVDRKRKLVLMSKDGQEFLMMVGGPTDVLVSADPSSTDPTSANQMGSNSANIDPINGPSIHADNNLLNRLVPQALNFPASEHASEPRAMETSSDRLVVASNDEINPSVEHPTNYGLAQAQAGQKPHETPQMPRATFPQTEQMPIERFEKRVPKQEVHTRQGQSLDQFGLQNQSAYSEFSDHPSPQSPQGNEQELRELLDDAMRAPKYDEEVVAEAVNLLNSEEEVTAFFDRTRSRVFQQSDDHKTERALAPRTDTDDFSAVLKSQQSAMPNRPYQQQTALGRIGSTETKVQPQGQQSEQERAKQDQASQYLTQRPVMEQNPPAVQQVSNRELGSERLSTSPQARLNEHALQNAEKNAKEAASRARQNASKTMPIQPIPETPEERVAKLKALLNAHQKSRPF